MDSRDIEFMKIALEQANIAYKDNEVPVGSVIVKDNTIVSVGRNKRESEKNALYHAEIDAINKACIKLGGWRLWQCEMFVTLEPCPMCAGAIINSRIKRLVFGAYDKKAGSCSSVINLFSLPVTHKPEVLGGVLNDESSALLKDFFKRLRK